MGSPLVPLNHTWTLGIEEQFYVLWPLALIAIRRFDGGLLKWTLVAAGISVVLRQYLWTTSEHPIRRVYFATDANAFMLLAGCALAILAVGRGLPSVQSTVGWAGIALLVVLSMMDNGEWFLYVGAPVIGMLVATPVIWWLISRGSRFWSAKLPTMVGKISYGLYLWHLPIYW